MTTSFLRGAALREAVVREGAPSAIDALVALGELAASPEAIAWGNAANASPPVLHTHDRYGNRIDTVEYHPAYHDLMRVAVGHGLHSAPWATPVAGCARRPCREVHRLEPGRRRPRLSDLDDVLGGPALRLDPHAAARWEAGLTSTSYDPSDVVPDGKVGLLAGMGMTEKQGGSDVRANTTRAEPDADGYRLTGHKWFCSAPMSDVFLMLAQAPGGLSCFVVPRRLPDGTRNAIRIQRLKDKLGNRSNASSEIELEAAWATRLGDVGRGVPTIATMVNHTRLDCVLGATSTMRQALAQAIHHTHHREAFGGRLDDKPLMRAVLADLALETEAATALALRLARAYDSDDPQEVAFRRIATAVGKYWVCKRQPAMVAEALECLGGNGYVEDSGMPRLFRESPLNGIWEGSGNVMCLDVLRAADREPAALDALHGGSSRRRGGVTDPRCPHRAGAHRDPRTDRCRATRPADRRTARARAAGIAVASVRPDRRGGSVRPGPHRPRAWARVRGSARRRRRRHARLASRLAMDRCDACAFVYADLPLEDAPARLRALADTYEDRLVVHDRSVLRTRPAPDVWSPLEYACHVRDVFQVQRERTLLALAEDTPAYEPMRREERVVERRYNAQDPVVVASEIGVAADALAATFEGLDRDGWARTGIYNWPTRSERDLAWLARHTVHEGIHHLRDVDAGLR